MTIETTPWESHTFLKSSDDIAEYLDVVFEDGDPRLLTHALGVVARTEGMTAVARETGLSRESLYKSLSAEGNPGLLTIVKVLKALGLRLSVTRISSEMQSGTETKDPSVAAE